MPDLQTAVTQPPPEPAVRPGPARVLGLVYAFFTLAAAARSGVQLATQASVAPLAYSLSAGAAAIYLAGTVLMFGAERSPRWSRSARRLCRAELAGVAIIGTASLLAPSLFPDATVWSQYGAGYAFVPAVLPALALLWLHRTSRT